MDFFLYMKYLVVLIFVLGLIGLLAVIIRKIGVVPGVERTRNIKKRLAISQMIGIDGKRRLVLVRRDDREHLLLLGPDGDLVVEKDILWEKEPAAEKQETPLTSANEDTTEHEPRLPTFSISSLREEDAK